MTFEIGLVLIILVGAIWLFATEKFAVDLIALMVLGALVAGRLVTAEQGVSGFSNPATITIAAMFVLSAGLQKTGAVSALGRLLHLLGQQRFLLLVVVMAFSALISAFINNTACVAILLPVVLGVAARLKVSPAKLLIPLSFASQFGGVCTLIGTSTNLVVSGIAENQGLTPFAMFEMGKLGLILTGAGILYFVIIGQWLLPAGGGQSLAVAYQLEQYITELRVMPKSPLIGKTARETGFGRQHDVTLLEILRGNQRLFAPADEPIQPGDVLLVRGRVQDLMELRAPWKLEIEAEFKFTDDALRRSDLTLVEAVVAPGSRLIGRTLMAEQFRQTRGAIVLAIHRWGQTLHEKIRQVRLRTGDSLLLLAPAAAVSLLRGNRDLLLLERGNEPVAVRRHRAPVAGGILVLVVLLATLNVMPIVLAAILGCIAMVLTRCLTLDEAYAAVDWKVIVLLAGVLPLGTALEQTGAARMIADGGMWLVGGLGPVGALAVVYLLTLILTELMSNTAAAVMMCPIALSTAAGLEVDPRPFLMAVTFAASVNFATPVGYQTNLMVYSPGGYRFSDYLRVGIPLDILFAVLAIWLIPRFWPF